VPTYPIEPDKLLAAADQLAPPAARPGRPAYTAHRRATSTAYYALFHAITNRVVDGVFAAAPDEFKQHVRRWIAHRDIAEVCRWVLAGSGTSGYSLPKSIRTLLAPTLGPTQTNSNIIAIADAFLELYEKRQEADYDHEAVFTRADVRGHIALARQAVALVEQVNSGAAETFFGLVALKAKPMT
jgi:hypothetical protein